jgi:hypothetical protein
LTTKPYPTMRRSKFSLPNLLTRMPLPVLDLWYLKIFVPGNISLYVRNL